MMSKMSNLGSGSVTSMLGKIYEHVTCLRSCEIRLLGRMLIRLGTIHFYLFEKYCFILILCE